MQVKITKDHSHRVSSAKSIDYKAGTTPTVTKEIGQKLIEQGVATAVPVDQQGQSTTKKDT